MPSFISLALTFTYMGSTEDLKDYLGFESQELLKTIGAF